MSTRGSHKRRGQNVVNHQAESAIKLSSLTWDVFGPPPKDSVRGKLVPTTLSRYQTRRKVSIEVHQLENVHERLADDGGDGNGEGNFYQECVVRVLSPSTKLLEKLYIKQAFEKMKRGTFNGTRNINDDDDEKKVEEENNDDDISVVTNNTDSRVYADTGGGRKFDGWSPRYRIPIDAINVLRQQSKSVTVLIEVDKVTTQERELIFDTVDEASDFCEELELQKHLEHERKQQRLKHLLGDIRLPRFETISLLIEIVSAWDIPVGDVSGTSDPFVVCMFGKEQVHKTDPVKFTLEPIWTVAKGALFILTVDSLELFEKGGLTFILEDWDKFKSNDLLGLTTVSPAALYRANGERMVFKLSTTGYLAIRCRRATDSDKKFIKEYEKSRRAVAVASEEQPKTTNNAIQSIVSRKTKTEGGVKKYKVRPFPDPLRVEETEWMTNDELTAEVEKPSYHWIDAGLGQLGKVHIEILECIGLPNLDYGSFLGNKTDAFVSIVHEDAYAWTETISDSLSPKWLPWTRRAFTFRIAHPSSQIFVSVFDHDSGGLTYHDLIGRVSIDITNLKKDVEYILSYNLYSSARVEGRKPRGIIRVRLRIEIPDERKFVLGATEPPPPCYLNAKDRKTWLVLRQTCMGMYDNEKFNFKQLQSYINELRSYEHATFYLQNGLAALFLWRGHFAVRIGSRTILLPIHSLCAFVTAVVLVEHPEFFPSFCFICIAWLLLAVMEWRNKSPNPWEKCTSYTEIAQKLITGKTGSPPEAIRPYENWAKTKSEKENYSKRLETATKQTEMANVIANEQQKIAEQEQKEIMRNRQELEIETKVAGGVLPGDPIVAGLLPVQLALGIVVRFLRFVKNVVTWEEAYFSFWLVSWCLFLSVACLFIPWFWLLHWTARVLVWSLFGPWMKLVDIYFVQKSSQDEQEEDRITTESSRFSEKFVMSKSAMRVKRENAQKLKKMKAYMFGKFSLEVPIIKEDRYPDVPLPESKATPYNAKERTLAELAMEEAGYNRTRLPGQTLVGDMIPKIESEAFTVAPTGQAILNQGLLSPRSPGRGLKAHASTTSAYLKIGAMVALAGALTIFGVPLLALCAEYAVSKLSI